MGKAVVLLVDENVERREKVEKLVTTGGFDVRRTETAYRALSEMKIQKFAALLVSGDMPDDQAGSLIVIVNSHPMFQSLPLLLLYCHPSDIGLKRTREFPVSGQINEPLLGRGLITKLEEITASGYETPGVMKTVGVAPPESIGKTTLRPKSRNPSALPLPSALPTATGQRFGGGVQPTVIREIAPDNHMMMHPAGPETSSAKPSAFPPLPTVPLAPPLPPLAILKPPLPPLARPAPPLPKIEKPRPPLPPNLTGALNKVKHALEDADAAVGHPSGAQTPVGESSDDDVKILPDEAPVLIPKPPRPKLPSDILAAFPTAGLPLRPPARPPVDLYQFPSEAAIPAVEPEINEPQPPAFAENQYGSTPDAAPSDAGDDPYPPNEELLYQRLHNFDHREIQPELQAAGWEYLGDQPGLRPGQFSYLYQRGENMLNLYVDDQNIIQMISIT